ncbi:MAG: TonB-dependent receptor, partial [Nitrospirae bacterium]|nr:TonB-dependent receptor [Nitrospirota bacterium]
SDSSVKLQAYYNRTRIYTRYTDSDPEITSKYGWDVADIDFQHRLRLADIHDLVWGADLRFVKNLMTPIFELYSVPDSVNTKQYSLFIQDNITLLANKLWFIAGIKLEHNDYTNWEVQPNVRLLFKPHEDHTIWMSVARADRMPSHIEEHIRAIVGMEPAGALYPNSPPFIGQLTGTSDAMSEKLTAYEVGYRFIPIRSLSFDIAAFYNHYDKLATYEQGNPFAQNNYYVLPFVAQNQMKGRSYGTEISAVYQPFSWLRLYPSFSWLFVSLTPDIGSTDTQSYLAQNTAPLTQLMMRSLIDISRTLELDIEPHSESALKSLNIKGHSDINLQFAWKPLPKARLAVGVQNLLEKHHPEFTEEYFGTNPIQIQRNIYAKLTWQY